MDYKQRLHKLLSEIAEDIEGLRSEDNLFKLGVLDSVLLIHLVDKIEEEFSISVEDRELSPDYFLSLDRMAVYVEHKLSQREPSSSVTEREA